MSEIPPNPISPNLPQPPIQKPSQQAGDLHYKGGKIEAKPMRFLGMYFDSEQAQKLWTIFVQTVNQQIQKDKEKALKALKKWREDDDS